MSRYNQIIKQRYYSAQCPYCKEIAFKYHILRDTIQISKDGKTATFKARTNTLVCEQCNKNLSHCFSWNATLTVLKGKPI